MYSQQTRMELRHIEDILEGLTTGYSTLLVQVLSLPGIELTAMQLTMSFTL
jgi:hypothetical protein